MKFNKILFLIILLCVCITLIGCGTPEGFDSDLWRDSKKVVKIIKKTYDRDDNFSVKDEEFIDKYFETYKGRTYDNTKEKQLIKDIRDLYIKYRVCVFNKKSSSNKKIKRLHKQDMEERFQNLKDNYKNLVK